MRHSRLLSIVGDALLCLVLATCAGAPSSSPSSGPPSSSGSTDLFAGLTYRLDLPADWIVLGSAAYETRLDTTPDVAGWLKDLKLTGDNAFRAYEPLAGAAGLRLAINPPVTWNSDASGPLNNGDILATLTGVTDQPIGEYVGIGAEAKAARFRWTQSLDWGSGSPTARTCVGYQIMSEFDPVNVVFTYPAGTDRLAEVDALMATFVVLGSPTSTPPPGATATPSPTPYDKWVTPGPEPTFHSDPALEVMLPDSVDGIALTKSSRTGVEMGMTDVDPLLKAFGKHPVDFASATAMPSQPPLLIIGVERLRGVSAADVLASVLKSMPDAKVSTASLDGREATYVMSGAWPVWYYPTGEYLFGIAAMDEASAARALALCVMP